MIFVGKKRMGVHGGPSAWVAVGPDHLFIGDGPDSLKSPCGTRIGLRPNEVNTLVVPDERVARAIDLFLEDEESCLECVRWLKENRESVIAAEKIGEDER